MNLSVLLNRGEAGDRSPYDGRGEVGFAAIACFLWFSASFLRLSLDRETWTLFEKCMEAGSFVVFAGLPIFFLATQPGARFAHRILLKQDGLWLQGITCLALFLYISLVKSQEQAVSQFRFLSQLENLIVAQHFWLNTGLFILGIFAALRVPFLVLRWRESSRIALHAHQSIHQSPWQKLSQNPELVVFTSIYLLYLTLAQTSLVSPALKSENSGFAIAAVYAITLGFLTLPISQKTHQNTRQNPGSDRFTTFDLGLAALCIFSIFGLTRPMFRFGMFIPVVLFIVVVIYGIGLGREHFGYSFQLRRRDVIYTARVIAIAILLLVPIAFILGFVSPKLVTAIPESGGLWRFLLRLISFAVLFSFRVGVFEEVLFRAGLLVFIRDQLQSYGLTGKSAWAKRLGDRRTLLFTAALICSVIFGLAHLGNSPSADGWIAIWQYRLAYLVLATLASLFYSLAFLETNRLWSSIVIHGFVDTTAVVLLGAELVVPF